MASLCKLIRTRPLVALGTAFRQFSASATQTRQSATFFAEQRESNGSQWSSSQRRSLSVTIPSFPEIMRSNWTTPLSLSSPLSYQVHQFHSASPISFSSSTPDGKEDTQQELTHTDPKTGKASMVSITDKPSTHRTALAVSSIWLPGIAFDLLKRNAHKKGDVLTVAQIAGIQAAKQTSNLIPLCHPLLLTHISVELKLVEDQDQNQDRQSDAVLRGGKVEIESKVACMGNTGVEMEALTGATVAALTVFDMCKAVGKDMVIGEIKVMEKTGGKSGVYKHRQKGAESQSQSHGI